MYMGIDDSEKIRIECDNVLTLLSPTVNPIITCKVNKSGQNENYFANPFLSIKIGSEFLWRRIWFVPPLFLDT